MTNTDAESRPITDADDNRVVPELGPESKQRVDNKELASCFEISYNPLHRSGLGIFQNNPNSNTVICRALWRCALRGPRLRAMAATAVGTVAGCRGARRGGTPGRRARCGPALGQ